MSLKLRLLHKYLCSVEMACGASIVNWIDPLSDWLYRLYDKWEKQEGNK